MGSDIFDKRYRISIIKVVNLKFNKIMEEQEMERKNLKRMKNLTFLRHVRLMMLSITVLLIFLLVVGLVPLWFFTGFLILFIPVSFVKERLEILWRDLLWNLDKEIFKKELEISKLENTIAKEEEKIFGSGNGNENQDSINKITKGLKGNYFKVKKAYQKEADIHKEIMGMWKFSKKTKMKFPIIEAKWGPIEDIERRHLIALIKAGKVARTERKMRERQLKVVV